MNIYVGNLPYTYSSGDLEQLFTEYGGVDRAQVIEDRDTGRSRGFGFVEMGADEEANAAIEALNNEDIGGRRLTVNQAKPRSDRG